MKINQSFLSIDASFNQNHYHILLGFLLCWQTSKPIFRRRWYFHSHGNPTKLKTCVQQQQQQMQTKNQFVLH